MGANQGTYSRRRRESSDWANTRQAVSYSDRHFTTRHNVQSMVVGREM